MPSTPRYPVVSTDHACCHAIRWHGADCTAANLSEGGATVPGMTTTTTHDVTARQSASSGLWIPSCTCGWESPPCITTEEVNAVGDAHYASVHTSPNRHALVDVGPATPAPAWCLPGAEPDWMTRTAAAGAEQVCMWNRSVGGSGVHIGCEDEVVGGRVLRSESRVFGTEEPRSGWTARQARELARQLVTAADLIDQGPAL